MAEEKKQVHRCGKCKKEWDSEKGYLEHKCEATGFKPTEIEHGGEEASAVSEAAQKRGAERAAKNAK